ncbi:hypothetical protein ACFL27_05230 [candidate division CSSED10-310 bacterium]|uniref:Uncharacterized protein n=1 Tax=candidate division CSSED10-310 bacterium TaxID=2855610 RepID=A0ABV6YTS6_UNCC1
MPEQTLKIKLPETPEKLEVIVKFLEKHEAITKEQAEKLRLSSPSEKSKWALLADRFRSDKEGHFIYLYYIMIG